MPVFIHFFFRGIFLNECACTLGRPLGSHSFMHRFCTVNYSIHMFLTNWEQGIMVSTRCLVERPSRSIARFSEVACSGQP